MSGPGPRWERMEPDARRDQILRAAQETFSAQPYEDVSLAAVARAAGVSRALVNHYFGGKRELFRAVQRSVLELGEGVVRTDLGLPLETTVQRNVSAWLDFAEANREVTLRVNVFTPGGKDRETLRQMEETRDRLVEAMLLNHFGTTDVPPQVWLVLRGYTGLVQSAVADWLLHGRATRGEVQALMVRGLVALMRDTVPAVLAQAREAAGDAPEPAAG